MSNTFLDARTVSTTKQMVTWRNALRDDRDLKRKYGEHAASVKLLLSMLADRYPNITVGLRTLTEDCGFGSVNTTRAALDRAHESGWVSWEELPKQRGRIYTLTNHLSLRVPISGGVSLTNTGVSSTDTGRVTDRHTPVSLTATEESIKEASEETNEETSREDLVTAQQAAPHASSLAPLAAGLRAGFQDPAGAAPSGPLAAMAVPTWISPPVADLVNELATIMVANGRRSGDRARNLEWIINVLEVYRHDEEDQLEWLEMQKNREPEIVKVA